MDLIDCAFSARSLEWCSPPCRKLVLKRIRAKVRKRLGDRFQFTGNLCYIGDGSRWGAHVQRSLASEMGGRAKVILDGNALYKENAQEAIDHVWEGCSAVFVMPSLVTETVILSAMKTASVFTINWDDLRNLSTNNWWTKCIFPYVDCCLSQDPSSARKYAGMGINWLFFPEGGHWEPAGQKKPYTLSLVHIGELSGSKGRMAKMIAKRLGPALDLHGPGSGRGPIEPEKAGELYRGASASLALSGCGWDMNRTHLKCRHFEIPAAGGLMLAQYTPELEELFEIGKEILTFKTADEAASKFHWILKNPVEAEKIRRQGHERARNHTWAKRFADILLELDER